jgi:uncharacterized phage protein gp47/JayE
MAFVPRTFTQIITDMIAYVQDSTNATDFTVGSVVRTMLEAAALEDDEQYFQMVQLLDIFSYTSASGGDLDRRLADFNIFRSAAKEAYGDVIFSNTNLITNLAAVDSIAGSTSVQVFDSTGFPSTGTLRLAERASNSQEVAYSALDTASNTFTVDPLITLLSVGDRVSLVSAASSVVIGPSTTIQAPATATENSKMYRTTGTASISPGNYYSNEVAALSTNTGTGGNTGSGRITQFVGGPPFTGAGVTNNSSFLGGVSKESDQAFRARAVEKLQSLSRGTVLAVKSSSVGVTDAATGQRVISSNVLEDFASDPEEVIVYIDDGTGLVPDKVILAQSNLVGTVSIGDYTVTVDDGSAFPTSGYILVGDGFLAEYSSVDGDVITLIEQAPAAVTSGVVRKVEVISEDAEEGQSRFSLNNPPIVRNSDRIFLKGPGPGTWDTLNDGTDYILNKGTGEFSFVDINGVTSGTQLVANYSYYTNLVAEVQKVLEGSSLDSVNYPGVKAAGVFLTVETPVFKRITVVVTLSAENSFTESNLAPLAQQEIETYITSLKIGEDVITSRIVDVAHNVTGVRSVTVQLPIGNVTVLENELPVPFDSNQNPLVTVL